MSIDRMIVYDVADDEHVVTDYQAHLRWRISGHRWRRTRSLDAWKSSWGMPWRPSESRRRPIKVYEPETPLREVLW